jgi:mxaJ protein
MSSRCRDVSLLIAVTLFTSVLHADPAPTTQRVLRVCGDPNNLPFSNRQLEGFENRIAQIVADELGATLQWSWRPQRRGFFRETLKNGDCDVVMGAPTSFDKALVTNPYYRSSYVWVTRTDRNLSINSFDDARLRSLRIGVQMAEAATPPAQALAQRNIVNNVIGYSVLGDYSQANPPARIIEAVAAGDVDIALAWGPLAGYFAKQSQVPLKLAEVLPELPERGLPFAFDIGMAVKKGNLPLRDQLNEVIRKRQSDIDRVLDEYGVPRFKAPGK